jgi:hypothetical protein
MRWDLPLWNLVKPLATALGLVKAAPPPKRTRGIHPVTPKAPRRRPAKTVKGTATGPAQAMSSGLTEIGQARAGRTHKSTLRSQRTGKAQERYDAAVKQMLSEYNIRVRKWRNSMSGLATLIRYEDGTTKRLLESPRPKSPLSMAIFLHEVGHHAIGVGSLKPRCLEEYAAWKFSIEKMEELGFEVTPKVQTRMRRSLSYAVGKALRRGIRTLPPELLAYHDGKG